MHTKYEQVLDWAAARRDDNSPGRAVNVHIAGAYGPDDDIVDFILGITFEIWEQRGLDKIRRYYGDNAPVYCLSGIVRGARTIVDETRSMLAAYPDRVLLGDDVIWSGSRGQGYYTSHRIVSLMTNTGPTRFGPATGRRLRILSIADCVVQEGVITREWLMRDYLALATQLGFDLTTAARVIAADRDDDTLEWVASEHDRLRGTGLVTPDGPLRPPSDDVAAFASQLVTALWASGDSDCLRRAYAPYAVVHRSAERLCSGRDAIVEHYAKLRSGIEAAGVSVDHVAAQPFGVDGMDIAVRWTVAGRHSGDYLGLPATGKPVFVMGATHWRIVAGRIACEWTVFDGLAVLAQLL